MANMSNNVTAQQARTGPTTGRAGHTMCSAVSIQVRSGAAECDALQVEPRNQLPFANLGQVRTDLVAGRLELVCLMGFLAP
jgi:hypothetical protein